MYEVEVRRRFSATPQEVWDVYTDHAGWSAWARIAPSKLIREGAPDRNGTGAVRRLGPGPAAADEEVIDFEPPKRMTYTVIRGLLPIRNHLGEVTFEPDGDGTLVVWRCRFESTLPLVGGLIQKVVTGIFRAALEGLARHRFPDR